MVAPLHAGIFVAPTLSLGQLKSDVQNWGDDGANIGAFNGKTSVQKNNYGVGLQGGYEHLFSKFLLGFNAGFELNSAKAKKSGCSNPPSFTRNKQTYEVTMKDTLYAGVSGDFVAGKFLVGLGLRYLSTKFSVRSYHPDNLSNYFGAESKRLNGYEPALRLGYKVSDKITVGGELAYAMYSKFTAKDNYDVTQNLLDERNIVSVKPKVTTLRLSVKYSF